MNTDDEKRRKHAEYMRKYLLNNPEARAKNNERTKKYYREKPEVRKAWKENNKAHIKEYNKQKVQKRQEARLTVEGRINDLCRYCKDFDKTYNRVALNPVTVNTITDIYKRQNGKCFYTGVELKPENGMYQMSVDRINSNIGHSIENCVLTTLPVNRLKGTMCISEFKILINNIKVHAGRPYTPPDYDSLSTKTKEKISNLMGDLKRRAKKANLQHELTLTEFKKWRLIIGDRCQITGVPVTWKPHQWNTGSVDRIDSSKGYTLDNVQLVIWPVNMMKNDLTHDDAVEVIRYILDGIQYMNKKDVPIISFTDEEILSLLNMQ